MSHWGFAHMPSTCWTTQLWPLRWPTRLPALLPPFPPACTCQQVAALREQLAASEASRSDLQFEVEELRVMSSAPRRGAEEDESPGDSAHDQLQVQQQQQLVQGHEALKVSRPPLRAPQHRHAQAPGVALWCDGPTPGWPVPVPVHHPLLPPRSISGTAVCTLPDEPRSNGEPPPCCSTACAVWCRPPAASLRSRCIAVLRSVCALASCRCRRRCRPSSVRPTHPPPPSRPKTRSCTPPWATRCRQQSM